MTKSNAQPTAGSPVYCSGPMFSHGDKWEQHAIATALEGAKFTTYLPQRDGIEVGRVMGLLNHPLLEGTPIAQHVMLDVRKWVFALDMFQLLERCQSLVFNLDGRTPDDGSVVETAAAFAAGKPIVIFKTTPITMLAGADNPMVEGLSTSWSYVDKAADVPKAVATAVAGMAKQPYAYAGPPNVAALMGEGKEVWDVLEGLRELPKETPEQWIEWLLKIAEELLGGGKSKRFERKAPVSEAAQTPG
jgi:nucleoside 2-deoxyribosyltransferase